MTIENTLAERGDRYGTFADNASVSQYLKGVIEEHHKWDSLKYYQKEALTIIMQKVSRILNGDPDYTDNWHDIAGYATLVEDILTDLPKDQ